LVGEIITGAEITGASGEAMDAQRSREEPSRVLLIEDHTSFREALAHVFDGEPDFFVVAEAGSFAEASRMLDDGVDLAVIDLGLPDGDGTELIRRLRRTNRQCPTLVLTASLDPSSLARAVEAGAAGVMHKSSALDDIVAAASSLRRREIPFSRETEELLRLAGRTRSDDLASRKLAASFTDREREVLEALAEGLENAEISTRLGISIRTTRTHMMHILGKLGATSRLHALILAVRCGAVEIR
jgi:DNA-binding NarL/FixJ family response regulator